VIGGGWSHVDSSDPGLGLIGTLINTPVIQTTTGSAFIGGIEGGDRYQFGKLVVGWEADMTWGNVNGTSSTSFGFAWHSSGADYLQPEYYRKRKVDRHGHQHRRHRP
jgi:hypothetical protein